MSIWLELSATLFTMIPLIAALLVDKYFNKKTNSLISTLVFPATYIISDLLIGLASFGTFSSIAISQFDFKPLIQIASIVGLGGISFMVFWFSSTIATLRKSNFNLQKEKKLVNIFVSVFVGILLIGGIYYAVSIPTDTTVKVAGITIEHNTDYSAIIDVNTPREEINKQASAISNINEQLFAQSKKAADFGAKIIFWSEIDGIIYPENEQAFLKRAQDFARENNVYFAPAVLSFKYDSQYAENKIIMINPKWEIAYEYEKTISRYPTKSDGIIHAIQTPYGKIATVICFDADFPKFVRSITKQDIDILLIPKFDTPRISPGHTYSSSLRWVEGGFSVVNQVILWTSIASDYRGNILAYQDFATTKDKIMVADVPTKGRRTLYAMFGDWFIYLNFLFLCWLAVTWIKKRIRK